MENKPLKNLPISKKIKSKDELKQIILKLRDERPKIKIVTTNGSFDILHKAHINLLKKAKELGDVLIVLLNSDESIKRNKGETRPIVPENERAFIISELNPVDYVAIFNEDKPLNILETIKPNIHVKGGSWNPDRISEEKDFLETFGCKYKTFDLEKGISTTNIIQKILSNK